MTFPFYIHIGPLALHPHTVFETLAYFIGFRVYLRTRNTSAYSGAQSLWLVIGAAAGAALGSKLLYWFEDPSATYARWNDIVYLMEGKTIVGGLLGGLIGVEITKRIIGVHERTGDNFVFPLLIGIAIGRVGCFLTGLSDHTHGVATSWPTGVDFGDGVLRHPTQLYEIAWLAALGVLLAFARIRYAGVVPAGMLFQWFMFGYLLFRFFIDFIKPTPHPYAGLNNIQIACILGLLYYAQLLIKGMISVSKSRQERNVPHAER
ncbi:prolipoprotein diacylglyceryl transferase [Paenibacillus alkalitolerans]|uniref:prolipoprotein diacylglyceryl transferase n=1 Tax=Paenibacillus alkalitolerans TaxID=2799335 RepID=UPI0018F2FC83|nr:prolipoprotein diacylglyceryl transferase family protein [Paenibacillus alkalitolerans]